VVARFVTRPLSLLADAAEELRRGRLDTRVVAGGTLEAERLGQAFNAMAIQLEASAARMRSVSRDMTGPGRGALAPLRRAGRDDR